MKKFGKALHRSEFIKEVKEAFPEIANRINHQYGLFHLEVHVFTDLAQSFIDGREKSGFIKAIQIADKYLKDGTDQIVTALMVSFLEHLNFTDDDKMRSWAWDILLAGLKDRFHDLRANQEK